MAITGEMPILGIGGYVSIYDEWSENNESPKSTVTRVNNSGMFESTAVFQLHEEVPVLDVRLSNGIIIRCTPDQHILHGSGSMVAASELLPGDLLPTPLIPDMLDCVGFAAQNILQVVKSSYCSIINLGDHNCVDITLPTGRVCVDDITLDLVTLNIVSNVIESDNCTIVRIFGNDSVSKLFKIVSWETSGLNFGVDRKFVVVKSVTDGGNSDVYSLTASSNEICVNGVILGI